MMFSASNLRAAVTLAETRHFGRAAERLFVSQPAFSQQIAKLERAVGVKLFTREPRDVGLTAAGEEFLPRARRILDEFDAADAAAHMVARDETATLKLGFLAEDPREMMQAFIDAHRRAAPQTALQFVELTLADQFEQLLDGSVDVALVRLPIDDPRIVARELFAEPLVAVLPASHQLAGALEIEPGALIDENFATAARPAPAAWRGFWSLDEVRGAPCPRTTEVRSLQEALAAVAYLGAVDTWPLSASRGSHHPAVRFVPVKGVYSTIAIARRTDDNRRAVHDFCELVVEVAARHIDEVEAAIPPAATPSGALLPAVA